MTPASDRAALERFLHAVREDSAIDTAEKFVRLAVDYIRESSSGAPPVVSNAAPELLRRRFDQPLPRAGTSIDGVLRRLATEVLPDSMRLQHPRAVGHQVSPPLPAAVWTDVVVAALNQSLAVREMSPAATLVEHRVVRWFADLAGFDDAAGGTITSGGTEANFTALLAARNAALPEAWEDGGARGALVCGEHAHYAVLRAAGQLGLGTRNVHVVPSRDYRMDTDRLEGVLERLRRAGERVVAVVATAGSTATGSFDDLEAAADACERHDVWLHVDGAHGASALISTRYRHLVSGISRAHSIAWDPHKMLLLPLATGLVLARDEGALERAFAQRAPYLFHDQGERVLDQGVRSFQCSRRADVLKLWVALQRYGADGIATLYDHLCGTTRAFHDLVRETPGLEALHEPQSNILCFRCVVDHLDEEAHDALNWRVREAYNRTGEGWITTTLLDGRRVLRVTVMNPMTTEDDVLAIVRGVARTRERVMRSE